MARTLGTLAVQMQTVAVGWQVYAATSDPLDLGLIGLSQFLPFILLILPAGHAADHYDRRKILTSCYFLNMTSAICLLAFALLGHARGRSGVRGDDAVRRDRVRSRCRPRRHWCRIWCGRSCSPRRRR